MVYDYVRRAYGVDPVPGHRVRHHVTRREGTIVRVRAEGHYVHVRFDGDRHHRPCHPTELDYLGVADESRAMKALTVWQPWATLIALEAKPYEFRGWAAPKFVRGTRIAIHAGARPVRKSEVADLILRLRDEEEAWTTCLKRSVALPLLERVYSNPTILALSAVVCTAVLGEPVLSNEIVQEFGGPSPDSDRGEHSNFAWPLRDIVAVVPPTETRGAQGFWNLSRSALSPEGCAA